MPMKDTDFIKLLKKNGWTEDHVTGSHHIMYKKGYPTLSVPVHGTDLRVGIFKKLMKQAGLDK